MENILTNLATTIRREVRDIGHMRLCDGFEYAIVTYRKAEQLVRRAYPDGNWQFVTDLEATIKRDIEAEQETQQLDTDVDPLALSDEEYEHWIDKVAWKSFLGDDIDPRKQQELVPSEEERLSLLEPTPYDAGTCKCGEFVAAGKLHEHRCLSWEERERLNDQERLAYCGWEEF